jgi:DNA-binding transcriptional MerR regulator
MEYSISKLAKLAGVTTRTLRYYDEIGLLTPVRVSSKGYRIYGQEEVDRLQQILFYRELAVPLEEIKRILSSESFNRERELQSHLSSLIAKREQLDMLISNVEKSIKAERGEIIMSDKEKFEGFLKKLVDDNEKKYGEEIRAKYGDKSVERSNKKIIGMRKEDYEELEKLTAELNQTLKKACEEGDPASELAQKACELHKKWLCFYWTDYSKEAHKQLAETYVNDPRFTQYYENLASGCAEFLRDALDIYL